VWGGARHQFPNVPTTTCLDSAGKCVPHGLSHVDPTTGSSPMSRAEQRSTCGHPKSRALGCTEATTFPRKMAGAPTVRQPAKANAAALILEPPANTNASWRAGVSSSISFTVQVLSGRPNAHVRGARSVRATETKNNRVLFWRRAFGRLQQTRAS
jgi:hypothetical protein